MKIITTAAVNRSAIDRLRVLLLATLIILCAAIASR